MTCTRPQTNVKFFLQRGRRLNMTPNRHPIGHLPGKSTEVSGSVFRIAMSFITRDLVFTACSRSKPRSWPVRLMLQPCIQRALQRGMLLL